MQQLNQFYDRYRNHRMAYEMGAVALVLCLAVGQFYSTFHTSEPSEFHGFTTQNVTHVSVH